MKMLLHFHPTLQKIICKYKVYHYQTKQITVLDFTGNIRMRAVADTSSYNLNIASLTTGNYLLKIEINGNVISKKYAKE
ncbi:MAG: T9SS type A sorting domain-containing protein [Parafilimonas sp.]